MLIYIICLVICIINLIYYIKLFKTYLLYFIVIKLLCKYFNRIIIIILNILNTFKYI